MSRYVLSPAARADLDEIWDYYTCERWDADQTERYRRELQHAIERGGDPRIGRACDEVRAGYRRLAAGSHQVYYRVTDDGIVDVVRILHQRMDVDRHL